MMVEPRQRGLAVSMQNYTGKPRVGQCILRARPFDKLLTCDDELVRRTMEE